MNREIKFRAWDGKQMFQRVGIDDKGNCLLWDDWVDVGPVNVGMWVPFPSLVKMQYTGLLDKNGREIYEGDIVICFGANRPRSVVFMNGAYGYNIGDWPDFVSFEGNTNFIWRGGKSEDIEIIGNIYEHPHLLENAILSPSKTQPDAEHPTT